MSRCRSFKSASSICSRCIISTGTCSACWRNARPSSVSDRARPRPSSGFLAR
ncbi:hypothetical protein ACFFX0_16240 [Citricoccus parietis]|uniref:Uncharacterized protein n=1 Tax=Citricoccus parietis TaxID=592307 RepID=A0ABV5G182_9MICC